MRLYLYKKGGKRSSATKIALSAASISETDTLYAQPRIFSGGFPLVALFVWCEKLIMRLPCYLSQCNKSDIVFRNSQRYFLCKKWSKIWLQEEAHVLRNAADLA